MRKHLLPSSSKETDRLHLYFPKESCKGTEPSRDTLGGFWARRRLTPARITVESGLVSKNTTSNDTTEQNWALLDQIAVE